MLNSIWESDLVSSVAVLVLSYMDFFFNSYLNPETDLRLKEKKKAITTWLQLSSLANA